QELVGLAAGAEDDVLAGRRRAAEAQRDPPAPRVGHLAGDRPHPDQLVQLLLVAGELAADVLGRAETFTGRADRLVGLLRVLRGVRDRAWRGRKARLPAA